MTYFSETTTPFSVAVRFTKHPMELRMLRKIRQDISRLNIMFFV